MMLAIQTLQQNLLIGCLTVTTFLFAAQPRQQHFHQRQQQLLQQRRRQLQLQQIAMSCWLMSFSSLIFLAQLKKVLAQTMSLLDIVRSLQPVKVHPSRRA